MTRSFAHAVAVVALGTFASHTAAAQVCTGNMSFSAAPIRIAGNASARDGIRAIGAELSVGERSGAFASAEIGRVLHTELSGSSTSASLLAGYSLSLNASGSAQFCPLASATYETGVYDRTRTFESSYRRLAVGGSVGGIATTLGNVQVAPFATLAYSYWTWSTLDLGAGLLWSRSVTVRPFLSVPLREKYGQTSLGIGFSYSFGVTPEE